MLRDGRARPGHPRLAQSRNEDVDARDKRGHEDGETDLLENWCRKRDSNPRPPLYESGALPAELLRHRAASVARMERSEIRESRIPLRFMRATGYVRAPDSRPRGKPQERQSRGRPAHIPETKHARERMKPADPFPDGPASAEKLTNPLPGLSFPRVRLRLGEVRVGIGFGLRAGVVGDGGQRNDGGHP